MKIESISKTTVKKNRNKDAEINWETAKRLDTNWGTAISELNVEFQTLHEGPE